MKDGYRFKDYSFLKPGLLDLLYRMKEKYSDNHELKGLYEKSSSMKYIDTLLDSFEFQSINEFVNNPEAGQAFETLRGVIEPTLKVEQLKDEFDLRLEVLVSRGLLTEEEVDLFLKRFTSLPQKKLQLISGLQSELSMIRYAQTKMVNIPAAYIAAHDKKAFVDNSAGLVPLKFLVQPLLNENVEMAIQWTIVQLNRLDLPGLSFPELKPYRQCHWCGRLLDEKSVPFPEQHMKNSKKYCHKSGCEHDPERETFVPTTCCRTHMENFADTYNKQRRKLEAKGNDDTVRVALVNYTREYLYRSFGQNMTRCRFQLIRQEAFALASSDLRGLVSPIPIEYEWAIEIHKGLLSLGEYWEDEEG